MAILAECPLCHRKQAVKNRNCAGCNNDLVKPKRAGKVHYWIHYRTASGKQRCEMVKVDGRPGGIEEARAAEGKRKAQKVETPSVLERASAEKTTFAEIAEWYLGLKTVKKLSSFNRIKGILHNFCEVFGDRKVSSIKLEDLEEYQEAREGEGKAAATIDMEISITKTMVMKAFDNDKVDERTVKAFRRVKRKLRHGANAREQVLSIGDYLKLVEVAAPHLKPIIITAYNTGMRLGELLGLRWSYFDREKSVFRLPADFTKEAKPKVIPVNRYVKVVLLSLPPHPEFVFTYNGNPIGNLGGVKKSFATACEKAGVVRGRFTEGGLIFHDIRRTVKTNMFYAGVKKECRDKILGHAFKGMDVHYLKLSEEALKEAMSIYTAWLDDQFANVNQTVNQGIKKGPLA